MHLVFKLLLVQLLVLTALSAVCYWWVPEIGRSAAVGGLIFIIPNTYFLFNALRFAGTPWVVDATLAFYKGQMGKLVLSAVGFALAFKFYEGLQPGATFGAFVLMMIVHLVLATQLSNRFAVSVQKSSKNH